jgi:hypothetical protein
MTSIIRLRNAYLVGLITALGVSTGCSGEPSGSTPESNDAPATGTLKGLEKDLKPPVVIGPSGPTSTETIPAAPKRE